MTFWTLSSEAACSITMTMDILYRGSDARPGRAAEPRYLVRPCLRLSSHARLSLALRAPFPEGPVEGRHHSGSFPGVPSSSTRAPRGSDAARRSRRRLSSITRSNTRRTAPLSSGPGLFLSARSRIHFSRSGW